MVPVAGVPVGRKVAQSQTDRCQDAFRECPLPDRCLLSRVGGVGMRDGYTRLASVVVIGAVCLMATAWTASPAAAESPGRQTWPPPAAPTPHDGVCPKRPRLLPNRDCAGHDRRTRSRKSGLVHILPERQRGQLDRSGGDAARAGVAELDPVAAGQCVDRLRLPREPGSAVRSLLPLSERRGDARLRTTA